MAELSFHDAANIFPMDDENIETLAEDIKQNKQQIPIELLDGKILDGRRRYMACKMADVEPVTKVVNISDPVTYVLSLNLHRRHLTPSQLGIVGGRASSLREKLEADAKERQREGGKAGRKQQLTGVVENLPQAKQERTRDIIGKQLGISGKLVDAGRRVVEKGVPELAVAVEQGRMSVTTAAILATEPEDKQLEEITHPKRNRVYKNAAGGGNGEPVNKLQQQEPTQEQREKSKAIYLANEAVDALKRIPKNDVLRKRGFQIVTDWIKAHS